MTIGLIGAGFIGKKRAAVLPKFDDRLISVTDVVVDRAESVAKSFLNCSVVKDWHQLIADPKIEGVIVSTTHDSLAEISLFALKNNKHVLCEKPLGISVIEVEKCVNLARQNKLVYKAGYNHRFHPAIFTAYKYFRGGKIGELMYIKSTYGHGGRPGYEKEWRMDRKISGGGELLDQGSHLIDLSLWFMGQITYAEAKLITCFYDTGVEDNAFILLQNKNVLAQLHVSWTEWKNRFVFEIYGTAGYLKINGLGGSYGLETLIFGKRILGKAPKEKIWEFSGEDLSWQKEWQNFRQATKKGGELLSSGEEGGKVLKIINNIYASQKQESSFF